ncbi:hypothetical protein V1L54_09580 [Streptomyces sp. TRM 70361]|uniref:hypothetical protein n=1 Tax=Streptomyces sp. TRM 70361 TaxID=3116553 RepID=UPI002E7BA6DA|nr:hypothetical protein [Streptomyces sp. TRM 70361]MEE1939661.1 hypothetical protein [Streptomyces sp. TRM 70361]
MAEKLAWEYPFKFRNRPCSITLQKFGIRLYLAPQEGDEEDSLKEIAREIIGKISSASRCIEKKILSEVAKSEVHLGRVTIYNQVGQLRAMYGFFRRLAERAYAGKGLLIDDLKKSDVSGATPEAEKIAHSLKMAFGEPIARDREGFYATIAMINAYFSLFEHLLVLSLPATDFDPSQEPITEFIASKIFEKYDRVFDAKGDAQAKEFRVRLREMAEVWRNPYGHGAFDKRHGTLHFQIPGLGPFPAILSDIRSHPTFEFSPDRESAFDLACSLFDELDAWLRDGPIRHGVRWAEAGLNVSYDSETLNLFRSASNAGDEEFERFLTSASYLEEKAANMEW